MDSNHVGWTEKKNCSPWAGNILFQLMENNFTAKWLLSKVILTISQTPWPDPELQLFGQVFMSQSGPNQPCLHTQLSPLDVETHERLPWQLSLQRFTLKTAPKPLDGEPEEMSPWNTTTILPVIAVICFWTVSMVPQNDPSL